MSWENELLNAQVSINRAVFEMNKSGRRSPEPIRKEYLQTCINDAIKELTKASNLLEFDQTLNQ